MSILTILMAVMIVFAIAINLKAYIPNRRSIPRHSHMYVQMTYRLVA